jgi:WD40 repeat protein
MSAQKGFVGLISLLLVLLVFTLGCFVWVYFKPYKKITAIPSLSPQPSYQTYLPEPVLPIDKMFPNLPTKELDEISINLLGQMVYKRGDSLFVAKFDGRDEIELAQGTSDTIGFAGSNSDGTIFYYFMYDHLNQTIYKKDLVKNTTESVFSIPIDEKSLESYFAGSNASVSPDGKYFVTAGKEGIYLYTVSTGQTKQILKNLSACQGYTDCHQYYRPIWSNDGNKISVTKIFYEGSVVQIVDPFTGTVLFDELPDGKVAWSKSGQHLAIYRRPYFLPDLFFINAQATDKKGVYLSDLLLDLKESYVSSADWSRDGSLTFMTERNTTSQLSLSFYNPSNKTYQNIVAENSGSTDGMTLKALPYGKAILLSTPSGLWLIDFQGKTKTKLPTKMDTLLAVF